MNRILKDIYFLYRWLAFRRKIQFFLIVIFSVFLSAIEMTAIGLIVPFISTILESSSAIGNNLIIYLEVIFQITTKEDLVAVLAIIFVFFSIVTSICRSILIYIISYYSNVVLAELGKKIYSQKLNETYLEFISKSSDDLIALLSSKLLQVYSTITGILLLFTSALLFISIISVLLFIDFYLTFLSMSVFAFLYSVVIFFSRKTLLKNSKIISKNQTLMINSLQEGVGSIRDIILDGSQKKYVSSFSKLILERGFKVAINDVITQSPRFLLETVGIILISILLFVFSSIENGIIGIFPILSALALGAQRIIPLMNIIYTSYSTIMSNSHQLNEAVEKIKLQTNQKVSQNKLEEIIFKKKISLKNLSFKYQNHLPYILNNINFEILKGSKIGIIGITGAGKSTFLDLVMGLLPVTSGQYFIDDKLLNYENIDSWRKKITHVPQDIFLTNKTILENIALGVEKDKIDITRVEECAKKSQIFEYIQSMPKKFDQIVGERGIWLSGGQRQRIGIARALYRNSELIVFDEATNALDTKTENNIMDTISSLTNITILIVTHRNESLKICDEIYEIYDGSVRKKIL